MKYLTFADLNYGDRFRILNDGWPEYVLIYDIQKTAPINDRLIFYTGRDHTGDSISIPGAVQWKLKLEKIKNNE